jgi:hypothetical protein
MVSSARRERISGGTPKTSRKEPRPFPPPRFRLRVSASAFPPPTSPRGRAAATYGDCPVKSPSEPFGVRLCRSDGAWRVRRESHSPAKVLRWRRGVGAFRRNILGRDPSGISRTFRRSRRSPVAALIVYMVRKAIGGIPCRCPERVSPNGPPRPSFPNVGRFLTAV